MIKFKISRTAIEFASLTKTIYSHLTVMCTNKKKIPQHTWSESIFLLAIRKKVSLHFYLKIIFPCIFIEKSCISEKKKETNVVNQESIAYCLTKFR